MGSEFNSRDFATRKQYDFAKTLRELAPNGSLNFYDLFDDFCAMAAISLQQPVRKLREGKIDDELEAEYMRRVKRYDRDRVKHFPEALGLLTEGLEEAFTFADRRAVPTDGNRAYSGDFLGSVFEATGCSNSFRGQFFTPWSLCSMMAKMNLGEAAPEPGRRLRISEPACGAGAMLLAANDELRDRKFGPRDWWFDAIDIDRRCFYMAYIQLTLSGAPGIVHLGDSLRMEFQDHWLTLTGALYPLTKRQADRDAETSRANLPRDPEPTATPDDPADVGRELLSLAATPSGAVESSEDAAPPVKRRKQPPARLPAAEIVPHGTSERTSPLQLDLL